MFPLAVKILKDKVIHKSSNFGLIIWIVFYVQLGQKYLSLLHQKFWFIFLSPKKSSSDLKTETINFEISHKIFSNGD